MADDVLFLDSITDAGADAVGRVAVCGSHGGVFAAMLASRAGLRAVVLNDAGIGFRRAGIAGVHQLDQNGMAAAAVDCMSAEIGSASDAMANGVISFANAVARALGVEVGQSVSEAVTCLCAAPDPTDQFTQMAEQRWDTDLTAGQGPNVLCVDSASLIRADDAGRIIVTGSHGGLIGGDPARACKAQARFVAFSDAGRGKNDIGCSRLPALDDRGIAAVTLDCNSCAIGSAASAIAGGVISVANKTAGQLGIKADQPLGESLIAAFGRSGTI